MTPDEFDALFDQFQHTVIRLETLPAYLVGGSEATRIDAYRSGRPRPLRSIRTDPWLARIALSTLQHGKDWTRVRVVDNPLTEYERYQLASHREAQACGETVVIAERCRAPLADTGPDGSDFWLFDHGRPTARAALMTYDHDGRYGGARLLADPSELDALAWRVNAVHEVAIPLNDYLTEARV